jgi:hypothetical protein
MPSRKNRDRKNRASRKDRKNRKNRNSRNNLKGGMAPRDDNSMAMAMKDSLAQGSQYLNIHKGQYGGSAAYPTAVTDSVLTGPMIAAARTGPLDAAMSQIQGMQDGGRRRKGRKGSKKMRMTKKMRKMMRKMRGGAMELTGSPISQDSMILPAGMDKQAALNYEWSMAKDPNAFAPKA